MASTGTPLAGQIVRLTKSIRLQPSEDGRSPAAQFVAGKQAPFVFPSGAVLTWWYGDDTFRAIDSVAKLVIESSPQYHDCDPETVSDVVTTTLQELSANNSIFDVDAILFGDRVSLFDCHRGPVPHFASAIQTAIQLNLTEQIARRCVLYAVPRLRAPSFAIPEDAIRLIPRRDQQAWQELASSGFDFGEWTPTHPRAGPQDRGSFSPPSDFESLLACDSKGTARGAKFNSILKFRRLLAVLTSAVAQRRGSSPHKSMASPFKFCIQFPHRSAHLGTVIRADCDALLPYYISDIDVLGVDVEVVQRWYVACERCRSVTRSRVEKAAHYLNRGLNADDVEAYINYFIALDALFGQRGSVEKSILRGVEAIAQGTPYVAKAPWLFELRNELVHGGSRYVSEWPRIGRYGDHFRSKPMDDMQGLAQLAVVRAPQFFAA